MSRSKITGLCFKPHPTKMHSANEPLYLKIKVIKYWPKPAYKRNVYECEIWYDYAPWPVHTRVSVTRYQLRKCYELSPNQDVLKKIDVYGEESVWDKVIDKLSGS